MCHVSCYCSAANRLGSDSYKTEFFTWNDIFKVWFMANVQLYYVAHQQCLILHFIQIFIFCLYPSNELFRISLLPCHESLALLYDRPIIYMVTFSATTLQPRRSIMQYINIWLSLPVYPINVSILKHTLYYWQSILTKYGLTRNSIKGWGVSSDYTSSDNIIWLLPYDSILTKQARIYMTPNHNTTSMSKRYVIDKACWWTIRCDTKPSFCRVSPDYTSSDNVIRLLMYDSIATIQARIWYPMIIIRKRSIVDKAWWQSVRCETKPYYYSVCVSSYCTSPDNSIWMLLCDSIYSQHSPIPTSLQSFSRIQSATRNTTHSQQLYRISAHTKHPNSHWAQSHKVACHSAQCKQITSHAAQPD
jgi:hypothetical protein